MAARFGPQADGIPVGSMWMEITMAFVIIKVLDAAGAMQMATVSVTIRVPVGGMWMKMAMVSATIRALAGEEWGAGLREAAACKNGVM